MTVATDTVTLTRDNTAGYGLTLVSAASSDAGVAIAGPSGSPTALSIQLPAPVTAGMTIMLGVGHPDGTQQTITLTAAAGPTLAANESP